MIRAVLAVTAGLLAGVAGMRQARRLRGDAERLTRWENLLRHLSLILSEGASTLPEAFEQASGEDRAPDKIMRALAQGVRTCPLTPLPDVLKPLNVALPERDALLRMAERVCRGSLVSRCQAVDQTAAEIALMASSARDKAAKDARMWTTLGFVGGACLTLVLI